MAEVYYYNSERQDSINLRRVMRHNGVDVRVRIEVNVDGSNERITVEPVDPDMIAVPWQFDVPDGSSVTIQIMEAGGLS